MYPIHIRSYCILKHLPKLYLCTLTFCYENDFVINQLAIARKRSTCIIIVVHSPLEALTFGFGNRFRQSNQFV